MVKISDGGHIWKLSPWACSAHILNDAVCYSAVYRMFTDIFVISSTCEALKVCKDAICMLCSTVRCNFFYDKKNIVQKEPLIIPHLQID